MFGFNKEEKESEKISKSWEKAKRSFGQFVPTKLFEAETHGAEGKVFGLINLYPVLRFMCVDLQKQAFSKRVLTAEELVDFFLYINEEVVIECLKKWREANTEVVVEAILKEEGLFGKNSTAEELRRQQLLISLSKDPNLLIKRANIQLKFMPRYVRAAIEARFDEVLNLELSRTSNTSNDA